MPCGLRSSTSRVSPSGSAAERRPRTGPRAAGSRAPARGRAAARAPRRARRRLRPATRELRVGQLAADQRVDHEPVERLHVGVRALAGHDPGQAQEHLPLGGAVAARAAAASSSPRCGPPAGRAPGRSATSRAARARGGSRPRAGSSRSRRCPSASMKSSCSTARSSRPLLGVDTTGLPATVISARTLSSPGVSISSASARHRQLAEGLGQPAHAALPAPEPNAAAAAGRAVRVALARGRQGEHGPALAVEVAGQHVEHVHQPAGQRAELLGGGARCARRRRRARPRASSRAIRRISSGGDARGRRHVLGAVGRARARGPPRGPPRAPRAGPGPPATRRPACRPSPASSRASAPGRMKWCSSASSAVRVRRGSTTTTLPPRSRMPRSRPRMLGAVSRLPFDTSGLAPRISRWSQRSTSGHRHAQQVAEHQPGGRPAWASGPPCWR